MAHYQVPPDPRDPENRGKAKRPLAEEREPIPWRWLGMGVIITLMGIGLSFWIIRAFLFVEPLAVSPLEPTVIILTAPPSPTRLDLPLVNAPTAVPTFTPVPTPNVAVAPEGITPGYFAQVINTEGVGVTVRGGPSTSNAPLTVAPEGTTLLVLDGPEQGNEFLWWQVRTEDGTEGWVAADFITPVAAP